MKNGEGSAAIGLADGKAHAGGLHTGSAINQRLHHSHESRERSRAIGLSRVRALHKRKTNRHNEVNAYKRPLGTRPYQGSAVDVCRMLPTKKKQNQ